MISVKSVIHKQRGIGSEIISADASFVVLKRKEDDVILIEVRCGGCGRLLGRFEGKGCVKCPKVLCGGTNVFDTECGKNRFIPKESDIREKEER